MVTPVKLTGPPVPADAPAAGLYAMDGPRAPAGQFSTQKRVLVAPPLIVSVACRLAERATDPAVQVKVMFCAVFTPAVKVSVAALVRVKLAASAPENVKLLSVVVPETAPPEGVTAI